MKIYQVLEFCKEQARIEYKDYGDRSAHAQDVYQRTKARNECMLTIKQRFCNNDEIEITGESYGKRLVVTADSVDYTSGQYAPTEIYWAFSELLKQAANERSKQC